MRLRSYFLFFLLLVVFSGFYAIYSTVGFSFLYNRLFEIQFDGQDTRCDIGALRLRVADELRLVKLQLDQARALGLPPDRRTLTSLESMIWQLDPSYTTLVQHKPPDVCAEVYANNSIGYPLYETGWLRPCGDVSLNNLLTVLLLPEPVQYGDCAVFTKWVLSGLRQYYPSVRVIIANRYEECRIDTSKTNVEIAEIDFDASITEGKLLNSLIENVKTPYVFIGKKMDHLNQFARFERQISVFSMDERVKVVSGAVRNITGHWKVGCAQTEMKHYVFEYQEGYRSSKNECMFCDYVVGPFVAQTDFLKEVSFDQNLPPQVIFDDFFIRVRNMGNLILNCPDVMYFTSQSQSLDRQSWLPVALKWQLNYVILPTPGSNSKTKFQFSCKDIQISCVFSDKATKTHLMPLCCIDQYVEAFRFIQTLAEKHKFKFEIDTGTVVGAVKIRGVLPWDVDGDMIYLSSEHGSIASLKDKFKENGFRLEIGRDANLNTKEYRIEGGYMALWTPEQSIELFGMDGLSEHLLPVEIRNVTTKAEMNGVWLFSPANPGLFVRNRYGVECLRHAQHWRLMGRKNSQTDYEAGKFLSCPKQGHHACLERFFADGNLQFVVPRG